MLVPPTPGVPAQLTAKLVVAVTAGRGLTELVGGATRRVAAWADLGGTSRTPTSSVATLKKAWVWPNAPVKSAEVCVVARRNGVNGPLSVETKMSKDAMP